MGKRDSEVVGDGCRHFIDLGVVVGLDLLDETVVVLSGKVDGNTLATETSGTTDTVNVVFPVGWEIIIDDHGDLLDVDTTSQKIGGDEDTRGAGTELTHDHVTVGLFHVTVHAGDGELLLLHQVGQLFDLAAGVAEDDGLSNVDGVVQIAQGVKLPLLVLNLNVELADTFKGQLFLLDKNTDGVLHEALGHIQHFSGHGSGKKDDLDAGWHGTENVVDLVLESTGQHFIGLVQNEHGNVFGL